MTQTAQRASGTHFFVCAICLFPSVIFEEQNNSDAIKPTCLDFIHLFCLFVKDLFHLRFHFCSIVLWHLRLLSVTLLLEVMLIQLQSALTLFYDKLLLTLKWALTQLHYFWQEEMFVAGFFNSAKPVAFLVPVIVLYLKQHESLQWLCKTPAVALL